MEIENLGRAGFESYSFGSTILFFDNKKNKTSLNDQDISKKTWWLCAKGHPIHNSFNNLEKKPYCSYCAKDTIKEYNDLPHKEIRDQIIANWEKNADRQQRRADAQMYSSFTIEENRDLIKDLVEENNQFADIRSKLLDPIPTKQDRYEKKVDRTNSAVKRFAKHLDNTKLLWYSRNLDILAEMQFLGAFSLADLWHTVVVWYRVTNKDEVNKLKEDLGEAPNYISAIVFPNKNKEPYSVVYPTFKSDAELRDLALSSSAFDHKFLEIKKQQKIIMLEFNQVENNADFLNNEEFGSKEWQTKNKIPIDTIQQRFAYIRQFLCGVSQNRLAYYLDDKGITIDQKGVKYWEEKETDEPSFVKNHLDDVVSVFAELSYALLHTPMRLDLERQFKDMPYQEISIEQVKMLIEDFLLYGTEDSCRYDIPKLIKQTTEFSKSKADLLWEQAKVKHIIQIKEDPVPTKEVSENPSYISLWIDILLNKTEEEVVEDLNDFYGKGEDLKKEVFFLWHTINTKYDQEKQNEGIKPPFN